jgi:hypothetical protein
MNKKPRTVETIDKTKPIVFIPLLLPRLRASKAKTMPKTPGKPRKSQPTTRFAMPNINAARAKP